MTYTREQAMQFLVERLDGKWPTDIADAPLCPGWGWARNFKGEMWFTTKDYQTVINKHTWQLLHHVSHLQPATAEQPAPNGKGDPILGMVLADLTNRALIGKEKYGEPLKAHNGRNALWDAYQEALDLCMYLRQAIEESNK